MSSILKALKKLEEQSIEENSVLVWPDTTGTKTYRSVSKNRKKRFLLLIVPVLILAGAGGYTYYHELNPESELSREKVVDLPLNSKPIKPAGNIIPPSILRENLKIEMDNSTKPELITAFVPIEKNEPVSIPVKKIEPVDDIGIEKSRDTGMMHQSSEKPVHVPETQPEVKETKAEFKESHPEIPPEPVKPAVRKKTSKPVIAEMSGVKAMEDPRIDLQAIAWAPNQKDSFVVINNHIIRVGGTIEGVRVLRIEKETVIFQEGSTKWQQEFRVK